MKFFQHIMEDPELMLEPEPHKIWNGTAIMRKDAVPMSGKVPSLVAKEMFLSSGRSVVSDTSGADSSS
jgi:hypothetical protein